MLKREEVRVVANGCCGEFQGLRVLFEWEDRDGRMSYPFNGELLKPVQM